MVNREYPPLNFQFRGRGVFDLKLKKESPIVLDRILILYSMLHLTMVAPPKASKFKSILNKARYVAGCTCGTTTRVVQVSGAIVKHDYRVMMSNLKNI
jgi:hypothetical protein